MLQSVCELAQRDPASAIPMMTWHGPGDDWREFYRGFFPGCHESTATEFRECCSLDTDLDNADPSGQ